MACAVALSASSLLAGSATVSSAAPAPAHPASSTSPITLPASLGGYRDVVAAIAAKAKSDTSSFVKHQRAHQATVRKATVAAYSKAFGGAPADYHAYANAGLTRLPWVIAVRAPAPSLTIGPIPDLKFLGLATPDREVIAVGRVSCEIFWTRPTLAGHKPNPANQEAVECERSGSGITVYVGGGGFDGPSGVQALVALANAAWVAVSTT
jgi:hypothetical protein